MKHLILVPCIFLSACILDNETSAGLATASRDSTAEPIAPTIADSTATALAFSLPPGEYDAAISVGLVDTTGLEIHFTRDGSVPTQESPRWTAPVAVDSAAYLHIKAWKRKDGEVLDSLIGSFLVASRVFGHVTDLRDGHIYRTVRIGTHTWLAENLDYRPEYGDRLDTVGGAEISPFNLIARKQPPSLAFDILNPKAGRAYSSRIVDSACMQGWRLPDSSDWQELLRLGGNDIRSFISREGWLVGSQGLDRFGFAAQPLGMIGAVRSTLCCANDMASGKGRIAAFWSATPSASYVVFDGARSAATISGTSPARMEDGMAIRCIKE